MDEISAIGCSSSLAGLKGGAKCKYINYWYVVPATLEV